MKLTLSLDAIRTSFQWVYSSRTCTARTSRPWLASLCSLGKSRPSSVVLRIKTRFVHASMSGSVCAVQESTASATGIGFSQLWESSGLVTALGST